MDKQCTDRAIELAREGFVPLKRDVENAGSLRRLSDTSQASHTGSEPASKTVQEFYKVLTVSKADLKHVFKGNTTTLARIKRMAPDEMDYLAECFGDSLMSAYWDTLRIVFEEKFLREVRK